MPQNARKTPLIEDFIQKPTTPTPTFSKRRFVLTYHISRLGRTFTSLLGLGGIGSIRVNNLLNKVMDSRVHPDAPVIDERFLILPQFVEPGNVTFGST